MKTKQKLILGCALTVTLVAPLAASAAAVAIAASDTPTAATVASGDLGGFVTSQFFFTPSRSVAVKADGTATMVAVQAGTNRGSRRFGGSSNGGSVKECGTGSEVTPGTSVASPTTTATSDGCI